MLKWVHHSPLSKNNNATSVEKINNNKSQIEIDNNPMTKLVIDNETNNKFLDGSCQNEINLLTEHYTDNNCDKQKEEIVDEENILVDMTSRRRLGVSDIEIFQ